MYPARLQSPFWPGVYYMHSQLRPKSIKIALEVYNLMGAIGEEQVPKINIFYYSLRAAIFLAREISTSLAIVHILIINF